jgi:hypothetical protein
VSRKTTRWLKIKNPQSPAMLRLNDGYAHLATGSPGRSNKRTRGAPQSLISRNLWEA